MSKNKNQKLLPPDMLRQALLGSFTKLNPCYMRKNPVMFVVEIGFFITLILLFFLPYLGIRLLAAFGPIISLYL